MITRLAGLSEAYAGVDGQIEFGGAGKGLGLDELGEGGLAGGEILLLEVGREDRLELGAIAADQAFVLLGLGEGLTSLGRVRLQEFGEMRQILRRSAGDITRLREGLSVGVEEHDRREAFDGELLGESLVLGLLLGRLLFLLRVIEFHEDEILGGRGEFLLVEDFLLQADAPAAPIAAGEVDQDRLLLGLGDLDALI